MPSASDAPVRASPPSGGSPNEVSGAPGEGGWESRDGSVNTTGQPHRYTDSARYMDVRLTRTEIPAGVAGDDSEGAFAKFAARMHSPPAATRRLSRPGSSMRSCELVAGATTAGTGAAAAIARQN